MPADLYAELEVPRGADSSEIKKAYHRLSRLHHPDKATPERIEEATKKFQKLTAAYEVLSDDEKRGFYDQTGQIPGEAGSEPQGHGMPFGMGTPFHFDMNNLFGMFGGGGGGGPPGQRRGRRPGKVPTRKTQVPLTLHDFYHGRTIQIRLERKRFCSDCKGNGAINVRPCNDCRGAGQTTRIIQMGPMMMQQSGPCLPCGGSGQTKGDACGKCSGSKFMKEDKTLTLTITKGMQYGETIVFAGESSNEEEYEEAGDVVIELIAADEDHEWQRSGDNLTIRVRLTLTEALCGKIVSLSNHPGYPQGVHIQIPAGVQNRQDICVEGYGMPRSIGSGLGDCIIHIGVLPTQAELTLLRDKKESIQELFQMNVPQLPEGSQVVSATPLSYTT
jgi:DnaJ-class molecular chaperone